MTLTWNRNAIAFDTECWERAKQELGEHADLHLLLERAQFFKDRRKEDHRLPSAADLDTMAEEQRVQEMTRNGGI